MSWPGPGNQGPQRGALAWMAGNSVAANLIMLLFLIGGLIMALSIRQEVFPEFSLDTVSVSIPYPGASPEEVEQGIVLAVEEAVQDLEGVKEIRATASEGRATVLVEALEGQDVNRLWQDVESEVNRIVTFPDEAEEPEISISSRKREVMTLALSGSGSEQVLREAAEMVRDELLQHEGITQVELDGVRDYEVHIEVDLATLRRYGLTLGEIARRVRQASVDLGAGTMETRGGDLLLRIMDRRSSAQEYGRIPIIAEQDGSRVLLEDIAEVTSGFEQAKSWASMNGRPAIMIGVFRIGDQTPGSISKATRSVLSELNQALPGDLKVDVLRDRSEIFHQRAELLLKNAYLGLGLVFLLLALFLETRLAFWVSLGIPISFLGSFLLLSGTSFSLNMVTMFAFIVTLGIVVDDAIVVGENVYYHRRQGRGMLQASILGVREVAMPVVFSVLTNMVAFIPMFFIPGVMGKIFKFIPLVVICVFAVSLIESLFILPSHLAHIGQKRTAGPLNGLAKVQAGFSSRFEALISKAFGPFLGFALRQRYTVLALGLAILTATAGFITSGRMGIMLFPTVESDYAFAQAFLPSGSPREDLERVERRLTGAAQKVIAEHGGDRLARSVLSVVSERSVQTRVYLTDPKVRPLGTSRVTELWREQVGEIPGLESMSFEADRGGPGSGKALTVQLTHRDRDLLETAGKDLAARLAEFPGVTDIDDGSPSGKRQLDLQLSALGQRMGLSSREVANQVRHAFYGAEALRQQEGRNELTVRVWLPEEERSSPATLENMLLRFNHQEVLLKDAVSMEAGRSYTSINRTNGRRVVEVTANVLPRSQAERLTAGLRSSAIPELQARYPGLSFSFEGRQADLRESVQSLIRGLLLALLVLYGLLAVPFRSYVQPMIIMACIPFGLVGAVIGHLIMGYSLSLMSLFGIVALSGVVINDSLVLVHFANQWRRQGKGALEAIQMAGMQRFRPILLTTLTTFGGLSPIILETSRQARFLIPMAISLGFGLVFATAIILVLVPCLYMVTEDAANLCGLSSCSLKEGAGLS